MTWTKLNCFCAIVLLATALSFMTGCASSEESGTWYSVTYAVDDSESNRLAMAQIVREVSSHHGLVPQSNVPRTQVASTEFTTNQYQSLAAFRSAADESSWWAISLSASVLRGKAEIFVYNLHRKGADDEDMNRYHAIKDDLKTQCRQLFGETVAIKDSEDRIGILP